MPNPVLTVEPENELKFKGCFEVGCIATVSLTNPSSETVLFKIKTTAPKKFCVRPNSGVLEPNSKIEITITSQPMFVDPNEKHKHKFMIQSVVAPEGNTNIEQVWKEIGQDQIMDYKFNCVFETAENNYDDFEDEDNEELISRLAMAWTNELKSLTKDVVEGQNNAKENIAVQATQAASPNSSQLPKAQNFLTDLLKATDKVAPQTEDNERKLRFENLHLQEEILRLHEIMGTEGHVRHCYELDKTDQMMVSIKPLIFIAIGMVLLGIAIGKVLI